VTSVRGKLWPGRSGFCTECVPANENHERGRKTSAQKRTKRHQKKAGTFNERRMGKNKTQKVMGEPCRTGPEQSNARQEKKNRKEKITIKTIETCCQRESREAQRFGGLRPDRRRLFAKKTPIRNKKEKGLQSSSQLKKSKGKK